MALQLTNADLREILEFTVNVAKAAGGLILEGSQAIKSTGRANIDEKMNSVDLVTEYDIKVEKLIQQKLKETYRDFKFIGEESYSAGARPPLTDEPTFCVDPIDGTTNFIHGFPWVCVSIGLIHKKRPTLGVIYNPFLDNLYTGIKGLGSFLTQAGNTVKLPLSSPRPLKSLHDALIAVEWGSDRTEKATSAKSRCFGRLTGNPAQGVSGGKMSHSLRSLGSAALNISMVAQGALDIYWEVGPWPWDVCAAIVIAEEAGGVVTGSHGAFADVDAKSAEEFGQVTEEILTGRKYLVVRAISPDVGETASQAQKRIIKEFYESVEDFPTI